MTLPACTIFFGLVLWHPQWLTLVVPFLSITTAVSSKKWIYMLYDVGLSAAYCIHTITAWPAFGTGLVQVSFLGRFLHNPRQPNLLTRFFPMRFESLYSAAIIAILVANCVLKNPYKYISQYEGTATINRKDILYGYIRFICGVGFYVMGIVLSFYHR